MIVKVKEIGTRSKPFDMQKESAERLVAKNPNKYQILDNDVVIMPLKKKEIISEVVVVKKKKKNNFEKDLGED